MINPIEQTKKQLAESELRALKERIEWIIETGEFDTLPEFYKAHNEAFNRIKNEYKARGML